MQKNLKKVFVSIVCMMCMCLCFLMTDAKVYGAAKVTELKLNTTETSTYVGGKVTLKVKSVVPEDASKAVKWKSSDTKIATVSSKGVVKGKKAGTVTITATSKSNKNIKVKCEVTVYKATKKIQLTSKKSYTMKVGDEKTLKAKVTSPSKGAQPIQWNSENSKIAKVNSKGKVTALKKRNNKYYCKIR